MCGCHPVLLYSSVGNPTFCLFLSRKPAHGGLKWDAATISNIGVHDLDQESFDIFRREALRSGRMTKEDLDISNVELLEKLDLVVDGKLKRAGALCFYRKPEKIIGGC